MRSRITVIAGVAMAALLGACHGPPLTTRIQPRLAQRPDMAPGRPRADDLLRTRAYLDREGRPESIVTDAMIDHIARAVRLRQEARRPPEDPCSRAIERARRNNQGPRVGLEERGSLPLPVLPLLRLLQQELSR